MVNKNSILHFHTIDSTSAYVLDHIETLPDRCVVIADIQTNGRGRFARSWQSNNPENAYLSFFLKGNKKLVSQVTYLTQFAAVCLTKYLDSYLIPVSLQCALKWPNDIYVQKGKIAGILAQCKWNGDQLQGVCVGVGINLNMNQTELNKIDQPATSLNLCLRRFIPKKPFIQMLIPHFFTSFEKYLEEGMHPFSGFFYNRLMGAEEMLPTLKGVLHDS